MKSTNRNKLAAWLVQKLGISPYTLFYHQLVIFKYHNMDISGEKFFIEKVLKALVHDKEKPIFFDVGANHEDYIKELGANIPMAKVHSFEPNSRAYKKLVKIKDIVPVNSGLSDKIENVTFYPDNSTEEQTLSSFIQNLLNNIPQAMMKSKLM